MRVESFLQSFRKSHRLTQKEMAATLDVTREHYARLESGKWQPSVNVLKKISSTIGTNIEDLFERKNGDLFDPELEELHEHIIMMDSKRRKRMLNYARRIIRGGVNTLKR